MIAIYESKGRAAEYCRLACNLYDGCGHGCTYCYAPRCKRMKRDAFHNNPHPRPGILKALKKDAKLRGHESSGPAATSCPQTAAGRRHAADIGWSGRGERLSPQSSVLLCFTTDPYQPIDIQHGLTRKAIQILHANNLRAMILTKGGRRSQRDFDLLANNPRHSAYGATLTFCCPDVTSEWEPRAASPHERITVLEKAHDLGIPTWASLEPVIDPEQTLDLIRLTSHCVDHYKIGAWNYDKRAKNIDWKNFAHRLVDMLPTCARSWYIKRDLRPHCPPGAQFSTGEWP